jgi:fructokinase
VRIGIDLGGTKSELVALGVDGRVLLRRREPTPRGDYDATIERVAGLVIDAERELGGRMTVGVGIPGAISPATGLVKNANSVWLNGRRLSTDLEQRLERPLRFANDANCFALSEAVDGAAAGASPVFGVILGTGTGGGIVVNGQPVVGANAIGGEWGHNPLPWPQGDDEHPGPACYCGRRGCIETFLSGPALSRDHAPDVEPPVDARIIASRARDGEPDALAAVRRYEHRLARSLAHVINLVDPEVIVLGGGLSNIGRLYDRVPELWTTFIFSDRVDTRLVRARHGDSSGVRGAAWLWSLEEARAQNPGQ